MKLEKRSPDKLRDKLEELGVELYNGETPGQYNCGQNLNLNALAIGLGLEKIQYEPETFPGLIYSMDRQQTTLVIYKDGQFVTVDAPDEDAARDAFDTATQRLLDLELIEEPPESDVISVPAEAVPTPTTGE